MSFEMRDAGCAPHVRPSRNDLHLTIKPIAHPERRQAAALRLPDQTILTHSAATPRNGGRF